MSEPTPAEAEPRTPPENRPLLWAIVVVVLIVHWSVAMASSTGKSGVFDELAHVTGGVSYWLENDYRMLPAGGVLPQRAAGLPLYLRGAKFPDRDQRMWHRSRHWQIGKQLFFESGNDPDELLWYGRMMIALASALLGLLVFAWSRSLFGTAGGFVSLLLYAFSPTMLAHGRLVTSDLFAALGFLLSCWALWRMFARVTVWTVLASVLAMGIALTAKPSGVLMAPIALLLAALRIAVAQPMDVAVFGLRHGRRSRQVASRLRRVGWVLGIAAVHVLLVAAFVWAMYGFRFSAMRDARPGVDQMRTPWQEDLQFVGAARPFLASAHDHRLLPEGYLYGVAFTLSRSDQRRAFLWGEHSMTGWWYFFPLAFLVKSPVALLLLVVIGLLATLLAWRRQQGIWRSLPRAAYRTAPLLALLLLYGLTSVTSNLNIGYRHVLPMLPALFVLLGVTGTWLARATRTRALIVAGLVGLFVVESLSVFPHFLSHFHRLVGGPNAGYRIMVDSSLDWGQDLPALREYDRENARGEPRFFSYFGTADPTAYGLESVASLPSYLFHPVRATPVELRAGTYYLSASMLQAVHIREAYGPWNPQYEAGYQASRRATQQYLRTYRTEAERMRFLTTPAARSTVMNLRNFECLQLARLCAALRQREPDAHAAPSILVYRLDDAFLQRALQGPPEALYGK